METFNFLRQRFGSSDGRLPTASGQVTLDGPGDPFEVVSLTDGNTIQSDFDVGWIVWFEFTIKFRNQRLASQFAGRRSPNNRWSAESCPYRWN